MYYGIVMVSVILYGIAFKLKDIYKDVSGDGDGIRATLKYTVTSSLAALVVLLIINKFSVGFTWFTLIMALLTALNIFAFSLCSFKALGRINLSLYSLYSMLGGMLLPFFQGIFFYGEKITIAKIICVVVLTAALMLTVKGDRTSGGFIYYLGIFVFNGMSGVLTKIFTSSPFPITDETSYAILTVICGIAVSLFLLATVFRSAEKPRQKTGFLATGLAAAEGTVYRVGDLLLVVALLHIDASVQYPMVTGGVMIISTLICFFDGNRPSRKELLAVLLAFCGTLALFLPV